MNGKTKKTAPATKKRKAGRKQEGCFLIPVKDKKTGALHLKVAGKCSKDRLRKAADAARQYGVILPREDEATF